MFPWTRAWKKNTNLLVSVIHQQMKQINKQIETTSHWWTTWNLKGAQWIFRMIDALHFTTVRAITVRSDLPLPTDVRVKECVERRTRWLQTRSSPAASSLQMLDCREKKGGKKQPGEAGSAFCLLIDLVMMAGGGGEGGWGGVRFIIQSFCNFWHIGAAHSQTDIKCTLLDFSLFLWQPYKKI